MKILIDGDGCPVVDCTVLAAKQYQKRVIIFCDTSHEIYREGAETIVVSKGADSADFALVNQVCGGDIVVTQDYGLAAMCLAKKAKVINQNGVEYTNDNIDGFLMARHTAKKIRQGGGRLKGQPKRTEEQNFAFQKAIIQLVEGEEKKYK